MIRRIFRSRRSSAFVGVQQRSRAFSRSREFTGVLSLTFISVSPSVDPTLDACSELFYDTLQCRGVDDSNGEQKQAILQKVAVAHCARR
jgi:hypothetical protein